ncbi:glycosyltransferase [Mycobacterium sp. HNNTM2301]|uniref:glycosyltransferase n=1 Tax=Mycobacterium hainanense TaxID=3289775 RepID=UPI0035A708C9
MRIAIVSGDDIVADDPQELSAALAARGNEVTRFVRGRGHRRDGTGSDTHRTVMVSAGPCAPKSALDVLPYVGDWAGALAAEWSAELPDVVHAYGWLGGLAAQLAAWRREIPTVQSFLGLAATCGTRTGGETPQEVARLRVESLLARSATWVTGESSDDVDALARLRHSRARVSALTSGVDVERYNSCGPALARTDLHRILCLAPNPLPRNGFDILIRALPRLPATELVLAETENQIHEHDEARVRLQLLAAALGVSERVQFAGTVSGDELPMLLRSADVLACTPRQPPRGTAALQAMASGVAVVAYDLGVLSDAVVDNVTGLLLPPDAPAGLSATLRTLLAQRFQCQSMGSAGRSRALSRYAWDRIALDCLNIYQRAGSPSWSPQRLQSSGLR